MYEASNDEKWVKLETIGKYKKTQPDFILITLYETSKNMVSFRGLSSKNQYKSKQDAYMAQQIAISSTSHTLCAMLAQVPGAEWLN